MGGFEMTAAPDVYKRWLQFGLLSTHSRLHGSKSYRVPWLFDEEAVDVCRKFTKLKLRLLPYLYSMAVKSHKTGIPSMRAMIMEFNDDPATKYLRRQYSGCTNLQQRRSCRILSAGRKMDSSFKRRSQRRRKMV